MLNDTGTWFPDGSTPTDGRVPLFCFPHGGGDMSAFRGWQKGMDPRVRVIAASLPGRERRITEPLVPSIPRLAEAVTGPTRELAGSTYALFGHSMGALVAFELAHRMSAEGRAPALLVVSGSLPPGRHAGVATSAMSNADFLAHVEELGGVPPGLLDFPEMREMLLPILRADYTACEKYCPAWTVPLRVPLLILGGDSDPLVARQDLESWTEMTSRGVIVQLFPGGHFFAFDNLPEILNLVGATVMQAVGAAS